MLIPIYLKYEIRPEDLVYRTANQVNAWDLDILYQQHNF